MQRRLCAKAFVCRSPFVRKMPLCERKKTLCVKTSECKSFCVLKSLGKTLSGQGFSARLCVDKFPRVRAPLSGLVPVRQSSLLEHRHSEIRSSSVSNSDEKRVPTKIAASRYCLLACLCSIYSHNLDHHWSPGIFRSSSSNLFWSTESTPSCFSFGPHCRLVSHSLDRRQQINKQINVK